MTSYVLSFKPAIGPYGHHDPSAALFGDGELRFGTEEERYTRQKHAPGVFPTNAITACLDYADIELDAVDKIVLPYEPSLVSRRLKSDIRRAASGDSHIADRAWSVVYHAREHLRAKLIPDVEIRNSLSEIGTPVPPITHQPHHLCHAASAFYPTDFSEALVLTLDGRGEYDSSVVWHAREDRLERVETYQFPNSLGHFFGVVTEYLGYHSFNGEGKVMGLAPYGDRNPRIEEQLRSVTDFGLDHDVRPLTKNGIPGGVKTLETLFDRPRNASPGAFDQFEKDLAYTAQRLLEETVTEMVETYTDRLDTGNVALAGGVALNCKMNKEVMEMDCVDQLFIQPVAHDGGLPLGAGWLESRPSDVDPMTHVYWGPESDPASVETLLETNKIAYERKDDVAGYVARQLADGKLVGWMQGRQEMGPRALGNRSILADPRTEESLDRVNKYVKHREEWRPFAPSMLAEAAETYLENAESSPYMIKTFETVPERRDEIAGVVHPADKTTRPQTVTEEQNPRYYRLISEFGDITGVPVVLNTSFNDHAEPIVTTPKEALRDFYGMGLDVLAIGDYVVEKPTR